MSLALIKKKFRKESKSHVFILGSKGVGKSALLKLLQQRLSMKEKGNQKIAGIPFETINSNSEEIYAYDYDKSTFHTIANFMRQPTTKCVVFVIDSRRQHIICDAKGNDIRSNIKTIAKVIGPQCHVLILCNKQDITEEDLLQTDEIGRILDIDRVFENNAHSIVGCSLTENTNTDHVISYLTDNHIVRPIHSEQDEEKVSTRPRKKTLGDLFKRKRSKKVKHNELVLIFGLDQVGKTGLMNSFGFGKRTKTTIAVFEAETIKYKHVHTTEFHVWNYEKRSWPMAKSFFVNCSLVIFVIDGTKFEALKSDKRHVWTVDAYLKKLLGIGAHKEGRNAKGSVHMDSSGIPKITSNPLMRAVSAPYEYNAHESDCKEDSMDLWPLKCPFLFYINKCDDDKAKITVDDLEKELQLSSVMHHRQIPYFVQSCSTKTKQGIYDGLIWCYSKGILTDITEIKAYAQKNDIEIVYDTDGAAPPPPVALQTSKSQQ
eukprot:269845_1